MAAMFANTLAILHGVRSAHMSLSYVSSIFPLDLYENIQKLCLRLKMQNVPSSISCQLSCHSFGDFAMTFSICALGLSLYV